ncbi:MAG TPA: hypothetical protein VFP27_17905 [Mycobacterium sp.]|nr:hypothetical protein [Mycobacterium sp.]
MDRFELGSYTALAEDVARRKQSDEQLRLKMEAEAGILEKALADALFKPYVGKHIRVDYNKTATLFRRPVQDWRSKTPGLLPVYDDYLAARSDADRKLLVAGKDENVWKAAERAGNWHPRDRGWMVTVKWDHKQRAHFATLLRAHDDHYSEKSWTGCGDGVERAGGPILDIGSQAVVLAKALAQEIGERLVI